MLVEFKVANFRSFRASQTLSLVASKDKFHPNNLIDGAGFSLIKTAAVYGPNASGKSTLINAIKEMRRFVTTSANQMNLDDQIELAVPFRLDHESRTKSSQFEISILIEGVTYVYKLSVTPERVVGESLKVRKPGGRLIAWFDREFDEKSQETVWKINGPLKADAKLLESKTRDNGLLLSRGADFNIESLKPLFLWFRNDCLVYDLSAPPNDLSQITARAVSTDANLLSRVVSLVRDADFGIESMQIIDKRSQDGLEGTSSSEKSTSISMLVEKIKEDMKRKFESRLAQLQVMTDHEIKDTGELVQFSLNVDESNGTRRFFALAGLFLQALEMGRLVIVDELDCSIHPLLTRKLIALFQSPDANATGAQLVFTTHDSSLMDSTLFRRDQVWLTEKRHDGSTDLFSLYDFDLQSRPRKSESLEKNYLAGRYGGIPQFGPTLEDIESQ